MLEPVAVLARHPGGVAAERAGERPVRDPPVHRRQRRRLALRVTGDLAEVCREQRRLPLVEPVPEQLCAVALRGDRLPRRGEPVPELQGRDDVLDVREHARLHRGRRPLEHPVVERRLAVEVRELDEVEELVGDGAVKAAEARRRARVEPVRHGEEAAALGVGRREGDAEVAGCEARDVDVRPRVRAPCVGEDACEAAALVVGKRRVGRGADALDVVGDAVRIVVVQRRGAHPERHVVHHRALRQVRARRRDVVVEDLDRVRRRRLGGRRDGVGALPLGRGRRRSEGGGQEERRESRAEPSHRPERRAPRSQRGHRPLTHGHKPGCGRDPAGRSPSGAEELLDDEVAVRVDVVRARLVVRHHRAQFRAGRDELGDRLDGDRVRPSRSLRAARRRAAPTRCRSRTGDLHGLPASVLLESTTIRNLFTPTFWKVIRGRTLTASLPLMTSPYCAWYRC